MTINPLPPDRSQISATPCNLHTATPMQQFIIRTTPTGAHEQAHVTRTSEGTESAELMLERLVERSRQNRSERIKALLVRIGAVALYPTVRFSLSIVNRLPRQNSVRM